MAVTTNDLLKLSTRRAIWRSRSTAARMPAVVRYCFRQGHLCFGIPRLDGYLHAVKITSVVRRHQSIELDSTPTPHRRGTIYEKSKDDNSSGVNTRPGGDADHAGSRHLQLCSGCSVLGSNKTYTITLFAGFRCLLCMPPVYRFGSAAAWEGGSTAAASSLTPSPTGT